MEWCQRKLQNATVDTAADFSTLLLLVDHLDLCHNKLDSFGTIMVYDVTHLSKWAEQLSSVISPNPELILANTTPERL